MVEIQTQREPDPQTLVLARSNLSMTLDRLTLVFAGLCAVTVGVALLPAMLGFWLMLPIAVIHLAVVGACLRRAWRGNWARERIWITPETVRIEHVALKRFTRHELPAAWLRVIREPATGDDIRVFLGHHDKRIEVGAFLPPPERLELARALEAGLRPYSAWTMDQSR